MAKAKQTLALNKKVCHALGRHSVQKKEVCRRYSCNVILDMDMVCWTLTFPVTYFSKRQFFHCAYIALNSTGSECLIKRLYRILKDGDCNKSTD